MRRSAIVYWLLPKKDQRELFYEIIRILCHELDAPDFEPHLTLLISNKGRANPKRILKTVKSKPIRMRVRGTAASSEFTKTLFVRFEPNQALKKLVADLAQSADAGPAQLRDPHVSLLYKKIPARPRKELASSLKFPFREVVFDSIAAVRLTLPVRTRTDVESWKIVAKKSLRG